MATASSTSGSEHHCHHSPAVMATRTGVLLFIVLHLYRVLRPSGSTRISPSFSYAFAPLLRGKGPVGVWQGCSTKGRVKPLGAPFDSAPQPGFGCGNSACGWKQLSAVSGVCDRRKRWFEENYCRPSSRGLGIAMG